MSSPSANATDTMAKHFRDINYRLASLERASSSGGGGGGGGIVSPADHWNTAWGIIGVAISAAQQSGITASTPLSVSADVAGQAGRWYVASLTVPIQQVTNVATVTVGLLVDGVEVNNRGLYLPLATGRAFIDVEFPFQMADGNHSVTATITSSAASVTVRPTAQGPVTLIVSDGGPVERVPPGAEPPDADWSPWDARYDPRYVNVDGDTMTGDLSLADPAELFFGSITRQMLNLYNTNYAAGVQPSTLFLRTGSQFAIYKNGVFSNSSLDPGAGGVRLLTIDAGGVVLIPKGASSPGVVGIELRPTGAAWITTEVTDSTGYMVMNHINAADSNGAAWIGFRRANSQIGTITQVGTTGVAYNTSSDERLKDVLGPVSNARERIGLLRPVHFAWKSNGTEQDGFLAHEVAEVVPDAVTGERGAVTDDGEIDPQQLDHSRLVPLLAAALQEALNELDELRQRVAVLESRKDQP